MKDIGPVLKENHVHSTILEAKQLVHFVAELRIDFQLEKESFDYKRCGQSSSDIRVSRKIILN